jgi:hypothetical protein
MSDGKVTLTSFWDIKGVVHSEFMPTGTTINTERYCESTTSEGASSNEVASPSAP